MKNNKQGFIILDEIEMNVNNGFVV